MARVFYRIVRSDPPTARDFTSDLALGKVRDPAVDNARLGSGASVTSTFAQARRRARRYPRIGGFVATLEITNESEVIAERTLASAGHYTLWAEPSVLLAAVREVRSLED